MFVEERKKGVLDVSQVPSSITAHGPGYIDQANEVIVWPPPKREGWSVRVCGQVLFFVPTSLYLQEPVAPTV